MRFSTIVAATLLAAPPALASAGPCNAPPAGAVVLTVAGEIANRGPLDPARDKFLDYHDIVFEDACALSRAGLEALAQHEIAVTLPDTEDETVFAGPRLLDVLDAAGAAGESISVMALDGYAAEIPRAMIIEHEPVLALSANGVALGLGDFGPTMTLFPGGTEEPLSKYWVWSVFYITSE